MDQRNHVLVAAGLLGAAAGSRSMTPPGVLALTGRLTRSRPIVLGLTLAALGELIGDKLPATPSRTTPVAVVGRVGSGAFCGHKVGGSAGAVVGGVTAGVSTYLTHDARAAAVRRSGLPDLPVALIEDLLAVGVALAGAAVSGPAAQRR
jgi:uncharacterized membrane protein